ncbi:GntR family transcriptional regulator [Kitasatospora sp. NPDC001574]
MTELDPTRAKWPQIVTDIQRKIANGTYQPGDRLSAVELQGDYGVTRTTITKAMAELRRAGSIRTEHGIGSFVLDPSERPEE